MDYSHKCRLCLQKIINENSSIPLFQDETEKKSDEDVVSMISYCVSIQIKNIEILPTKICNLCFDDLRKCKDFKKKCEDSDLELKNFLRDQEAHVKEDTSGDDKTLLLPLLTPEVTLTEGNEIPGLKNNIGTKIKVAPGIKLKEVKIRIKKLAELNGKCEIKNETVKSSDDNDEDTPLSDMVSTVKKEKYQCSFCEETFRREVTKQMHEKTHKVLYKCVLCYESFQTHLKLQRHRKDVHNEDPYCCSFCSKTFSDIHTWTNHLKKVHVSCSRCKSYFKTQKDLDEHACLMRSRKKGFKSSEESQNRIQYAFPRAKRGKYKNSKLAEKKRLPKKNYYQIKKQKLIEATKSTEFVPVNTGPKEKFLPEDNKSRSLFPCIRCDQDFADKGSLICHQAVAHPGQPIDNTQRPPKKSVLFCKFCLSFFRHISDMNAHICQRNYPVNQNSNSPMPINMALAKSLEKTLPIPMSIYKKTFKTYSKPNSSTSPKPEEIEKKPVISKLLPVASGSRDYPPVPTISNVYGGINPPLSEVTIKQERIDDEDMEESILPEPQISIRTDDIPCNQYFNPNKRKKFTHEEIESPESVFRVNPNILETFGIRQDMTL